MNIILVMLITFCPAIFIWKFIYKNETEKMPKSNLKKIIKWEILLVFIAGFLENVFKPVESIWYTLILVIIEEISKFIPVYIITKNRETKNVYDFVVLSTFSSVVFAIFENIMYILNGSDTILLAISRGLITAPMHISCGIIFGYFTALSYQAANNQKIKKFYKYLMYSILLPIIYHTCFNMYNHFPTNNINLYAVLSLIGKILIFVFNIYIIIQSKKISMQNETIYESSANQNFEKKFIAIDCLAIIFLLVGWYI